MKSAKPLVPTVVSELFKNAHLIHDLMNIALRTVLPERVVDLDWSDSLEPTSEVSPAHYEEVQDMQVQIDHYVNVEREDNEERCKRRKERWN